MVLNTVSSMYKFYASILLLLVSSTIVRAQAGEQKTQIVAQDSNVKSLNVAVDTNAKKILVKDTSAHVENQSHGLLNDDPIYNKRFPWWEPALQVVAQNVALNLVDHYLLNLEFAVVGFNSWSKTATAGFPWSDKWKWDQDRFGNNFFLHPLTGAAYFNAARSNGLTFYEAIPYAFGGSYMWKSFGENAGPDGRPEREDIINTTVLGIFGGEVTYRLSSNILDDRTTGTERFFRELAAGLLAPQRFVHRLIHGKLTSVTTGEVYQKEPLDIVFSAGARTQGANTTKAIFNMDIEYGDPFEKRFRKPFDYFLLRVDATVGDGRKLIDNIIGEGTLFVDNFDEGTVKMLGGAFLHYDYWDSRMFELATVAISGGLMSKLAIGENTNLYTNLHLGIVPFAGNNREEGPDTTQFRDYYFSMGAETKLEVTLNYKGFVSATVLGYFYWLNNVERPLLVGRPQNDYITIIKPRIEFHLFDRFGVGFEHLMYMDNRVFSDNSTSYTSKSQEKLFLLIYLADFLHNK